jgi:hypothetical protein
MNIFYLHDDPKTCAEMHLDKHCVKMILEYAQLLSTAHRMLDGKQYTDKTSGRSIQRWRMDNEGHEKLLFKASHINHPSAVWARSNFQNYYWLGQLLVELCAEYTHRYNKVHSVDASGLAHFLATYEPRNIPIGPFTEPPPAMPDHCKVPLVENKGVIVDHYDSIASYKKYYLTEKRRFAVWTNRVMPDWFAEGLKQFDQACLIENDIKRNRIISKPIAAI